MRVREEWKQPVDRKGIIIALVVTVFIVVGIAKMVMSGHNLLESPRFWQVYGGFFLTFIAIALVRNPKWFRNVPYLLTVSGAIFGVAQGMVSEAHPLHSLFEGGMMIFLLAGFACYILDFRRQRRNTEEKQNTVLATTAESMLDYSQNEQRDLQVQHITKVPER